MTIHFSFTVLAAILLFMVLVSLLLHKRLPISLHRSFFWLLIIDLFTMAAGYIAFGMHMNPSYFHPAAVYSMTLIFYMAFILRSCWFTVVTIDLMEDGRKITERERHLAMAVCISMELFLIGSGLFNGVFRIDQTGFHTGPLYPFINLQSLFWILFGYVMTIRSRYQNRRPCFVHEGILLAGLILNMADPDSVAMDLFCLFAIQIIYLFEVDPGRYTDPPSGLFNREGWRRILMDRNGRKNSWFVGFAILNFEFLFRSMQSDVQRKNILFEISGWLMKTFPDLNCCYLSEGRFILDSDHPFDTAETVHQLNVRFLERWGSDPTSYYFHIAAMQSGKDFACSDSDLISGTIRDAFNTMIHDRREDSLILHQNRINEYKRRSEIGSYLDDALSSHTLTMYLQPVVESGNGPLAGAEALARLKCPDGTIAYPDSFIPIAQERGLLPEIGTQMMENACAFLARHKIQNSSLKCINVNVAPEQMLNQNLLEEFLAIVKKYNVSPEQIQLEITEESTIDSTLLHDQMERFVQAGFRFALDDYGSANSSYVRLSRNHFATLKLDKDLVWTWSKNPDRYLPDFVNMIHEKNMLVVAEGVEDEEMLKQISDAGCDCIQGYYYSKPIPQDQFAAKYLNGSEA